MKSIRGQLDNLKTSKICDTGVTEGEKKELSAEKLFEEIRPKLPPLMKDKIRDSGNFSSLVTMKKGKLHSKQAERKKHKK